MGVAGSEHVHKIQRRLKVSERRRGEGEREEEEEDAEVFGREMRRGRRKEGGRERGRTNDPAGLRWRQTCRREKTGQHGTIERKRRVKEGNEPDGHRRKGRRSS